MSRTYWLGLLAICSVTVCSYVLICSALIQSRANWLIQTTSEIFATTGKTLAVSDALVLYQGRLKRMPECTATSCGYETVVSNRLLAALHWTPYSEIRTTVWVENGLVKNVDLDFTSTASHLHAIVSHVYVQDGEGLDFSVDPWEDTSPTETNGIVTVAPESFRAHKQIILGFDTKCLTRRPGCPSVADLLPTVWERRSDGLIRCRLRNREGWVEAPVGW
jgi:hypothetical protein